MNKWLLIIGAATIAILTNTLSGMWAASDNKISWLLLLVVLLSPLVFISFGLVTSKVGFAITSGILDSLLTIGSIAVGLLFFREWNHISLLQYLGILCACIGIWLMVFFPKAG